MFVVIDHCDIRIKSVVIETWLICVVIVMCVMVVGWSDVGLVAVLVLFVLCVRVCVTVDIVDGVVSFVSVVTCVCYSSLRLSLTCYVGCGRCVIYCCPCCHMCCVSHVCYCCCECCRWW